MSMIDGAKTLALQTEANEVENFLNSVINEPAPNTIPPNNGNSLGGQGDYGANGSNGLANGQQQSQELIHSWQNFEYPEINVQTLMNEATFILVIAILIEMFIPISHRIKLSGLTWIFNGLGRKVNRPSFSSSQRAFAGVLLPVLIIGILMALVLILDIFSGFDPIVSFVVMLLLLELHFPQARSVQIHKALQGGFNAKAKDLLGSLVLREVDKLSSMGIAKATCESTILRIFEGWFAVIVWYYIAGIEGALLMQSVALLSRSYNYKLRGNYHFGKPLFYLHQTMCAVPLVLLLLVLFVSKNPGRHIGGAVDGLKRYPAPISGAVLGAIGASLNLTLGGPRYYQGVIVRLPKVGGEFQPDQFSILYSMRKIRMCGLILAVIALIIGLNF